MLTLMIFSSELVVDSLTFSPTLQTEINIETESLNPRELVYNIPQANNRNASLMIAKVVLGTNLLSFQSIKSNINPFYFKHSIYARFCAFLL